MKWKLPPKIKIYEALGTIADKRLVGQGFLTKTINLLQ